MGDIVIAIFDFPATKWLLLIFLFVMPLASLLTWMERRQSAMMQDRLGPNRANIGPIKIFGILHFVADALKMMFKEDFTPGKAHKGLFALAPILALAPVLIAFAIIPFGPTIYPHALFQVIDPVWLENQPTTYAEMFRAVGDAITYQSVLPPYSVYEDAIDLQMFQVEYGLILYFAILTLANYGATIAGWASYNKWALLGGLRASSQMMSYEVAMGLSIMGVFLVMGTLEPSAMVAWQDHHVWGIVVQPLAFLLFFTAAIAETKRGPFDIPEGEPEIIGYFVEYSGIRWGMFFLAEFIEIVFISAVLTTVFFGGYHVPFLHADGFYLPYLGSFFGYEWGNYALFLPHIVVVLIQLLVWGLKVVFFCWLQLTIRWTLPRFRGDQLMNLGWKWLLPLALANIMVTAAVLPLGIMWLLPAASIVLAGLVVAMRPPIG